MSICDDDADDALQRAALILLAKAPTTDPGRLAAWMFVVTRREALAVRRARERELLVAPAAGGGESGGEGALEAVACDRPGPAERFERRERVRDALRELALLKPQERLAIVLQAEGYSYAEICELCGWSYTKVNRSLAEGRARLRGAARGI